jgi:hypothetical protein
VLTKTNIDELVQNMLFGNPHTNKRHQLQTFTHFSNLFGLSLIKNPFDSYDRCATGTDIGSNKQINKQINK